MKFEWDPAKSAANRRKHGITFEEAKTVFYDDFVVQFFDDEHSADECQIFASRPESLRVFRSCPLITPKDAQSSLQMLAIARYGCALRLDRTPFVRAARSARKTLSL